MSQLRVIDSIKVAFARSEDYFLGFHTPSMGRIAKETGADIVLLLSEGKDENSMTDDELRTLLAQIKNEVDSQP